MPPKKETKKEAIARPDNSGIPKNDVDFKFEFAVKVAPQGPTYAIMYEWFGTTSEKTDRYDTGFIQSWSKNPTDPTQLVFQKTFDPIRIDDDFCKRLCSNKFYLYIVDEQTKVKYQTNLDLSSLLMGTSGPQTFSYSNDKLPILQIQQLKLSITASKQLLGDLYRKYLNPFQVEVIGAKDVPDSAGKEYLPAYVKYGFFDGTEVSTHGVYGQGKVVWGSKHVFLAGLIDPTLLKQKLRSNYMRFQLHDRDELVKNAIKPDIPLLDVTKIIAEEAEKEKPVEDDKKKGGKKETKKQTKEPQKKDTKKDAKKDTKKKDVKLGQPIKQNKKIQTVNSSYGIAAFFLVDFLQPNNKHFKLRSPVIPRNTFEDFESKNIDLNTTARTEMQKVIASNNYFDNDTTLVVGFTLSCPIGSFVKPDPVPEPVAAEDPKKKKDSKQPPKKEEERPPSPPKPKAAPPPTDIYQRVIYLMPYKSPELIKIIQDIFYTTNLKALNLPPTGIKELTTTVLKPEQKTDKALDIMTGVEILDNQFRMYILEGLREGAMKQLGQKIQKENPNTKSNKIIKNSTIGFLDRLYTDFNVDIKRIRLRPNLTELLLEPNIYIKSKVPEQICATLNHISDIKKIADNLKTVQSMNWWPQAKWLIQIQRKFSDSLSYQDIYGIQQLKRTKRPQKVRDQQNQSSPATATISRKQDTSLPKLDLRRSSAGAQGSGPGVSTNKSLSQAKSVTFNHKTYSKTGYNDNVPYNLHLKYADVPPGEEVYMYAGQANNWYEKQMRNLRERMQNQKNFVYTYGKDHLALSIDPVSLEQRTRQQAKFSRTPVQGKPPFSSLIVRTQDQKLKLPKRPHESTIQAMQQYPYHQDKRYQNSILKNTRGLPIEGTGTAEQFKSYIGKIDVFSHPEVVEGEKIAPAERERMMREQRRREDEEERCKMKGEPYIYVKKQYYSDHPAQLDKYKGILEGDVCKKGLLLNKNTVKNAKVTMTRQVPDLPVSAFIHYQFDASHNPLVRVDHPQLALVPQQFHNFQNPQFLTKTGVHKPLKKTNFD